MRLFYLLSRLGIPDIEKRCHQRLSSTSSFVAIFIFATSLQVNAQANDIKMSEQQFIEPQDTQAPIDDMQLAGWHLEELKVLTLAASIERALKNDEWLLKSDLLESRLEHLSQGARALPDPIFSIGMLNLPTDGFAIDQEPMTQIKIGASQMFGRGDSLALAQKRYQMSAKEQPYLRANRRHQLSLQATQLWLEAFKASASYHLVNDTRPLFDKLSDIVSAGYAASSSNANQQDIIRAELELVRLSDRLIELESMKQVSVSQLSQFLFSSQDAMRISRMSSSMPIKLPQTLPEVDNVSKNLARLAQRPESSFYTLVTTHPLVSATEQRVKASAIDIDIAEQAYKPQYALNASYALRDDAPDGQSRADFFSLGVSVSVPLFSSARQDANVSSATLMTEAIRTEKLLIIKELVAGLKSAYAEYQGMTKRLRVYESQILQKSAQQVQAAINAYTNDTGDFAEVVRAQIDHLDVRIAVLNIRVKLRLAIAKIQYFLAGSPQVYQSEYSSGENDLMNKNEVSHNE